MGTNCAPLLADLFLYSYEAEFIQTLIKSGKRHLAKSFCFTYRYIDDVLSINNPKFGDYINIIYPVELEYIPVRSNHHPLFKCQNPQKQTQSVDKVHLNTHV